VSLNGRPIPLPARHGSRPAFAGAARGSGRVRTRPGRRATVSIKRRCDVVVSAHASPMDLNPAFLAVIAASVSTGRAWIVPAGPAVSPSPRRRRRVGRASGEAAHGRFWLRSPLRGTPCPRRLCGAPRPEPRRSGRRLISVRSRKPSISFAPRFCTKKAQSLKWPNLGAPTTHPRSPVGGKRSFDDLVGACEDRLRDSQAERLGGLHIDHQFKFGRLLDG
jgi:hypothetical protein